MSSCFPSCRPDGRFDFTKSMTDARAVVVIELCNHDSCSSHGEHEKRVITSDPEVGFLGPVLGWYRSPPTRSQTARAEGPGRLGPVVGPWLLSYEDHRNRLQRRPKKPRPEVRCAPSSTAVQGVSCAPQIWLDLDSFARAVVAIAGTNRTIGNPSAAADGNKRLALIEFVVRYPSNIVRR